MDVTYSPENETLYAEPLAEPAFIDGTAGYVEDLDRPAKVQFYDDFMEEFAGRDAEREVHPRALRGELEQGLSAHEGVNVRVQAGGYAQAVFGYDAGRLTLRVENPERHDAPGIEATVAEYFPDVAEELRNA